jgi:methionine-rich copper-binding protein CopC
MPKLSLIIAAVLLLATCTLADTTSPKVVATSPADGATDVDPATKTLSVTFNEAMQDGNWSWAYTVREEFPEVAGQPKYTNGFTKNVLPVKLKPGHKYVIWINSKTLKNFKDQAGNPAVPYKFTFTTRR